MAKTIVHQVDRANSPPHRPFSHDDTGPLTPAQQATIENALCIALNFIRHPHAVPASIRAATSRAALAAALLQQACEGRA